MLRPFVRAGVLSARSSIAPPRVATAPALGTGVLATGVPTPGRPAFGGSGAVTASGFSGSTAVKISNDTVLAAVGVNTRFRLADYAATSTLVAALQSIGVQHVRDLLVTGTQPAVYQTLKTAGIKFTVIAGNPSGRDSQYTTAQISDALAMLKTSPWAGCVEAIEGPNLWDQRGGGTWVTDLKAYTRALYSAVRADPYFTTVPVKGPTLGSSTSYSTYGTDPYTDGASTRPYDTGLPEDSTVQDWVSAAQASFGATKPVHAAEFGYYNNSVGSKYVDEATAADYLIRSILWTIGRGVSTTMVYELIDRASGTGAGDSYGLLHTDGTFKAAATALKNFLGRMVDGGTGAPLTGYQFSTVTSGTDVNIVPIGRRNGVVDFAVWRAAPLWDSTTHTTKTVSAVPVTFTLSAAKSASSYRPKTAATVSLSTSSTTFTVQADGNVQLVRVS